jgi:hypothetical protein
MTTRDNIVQALEAELDIRLSKLPALVREGVSLKTALARIMGEFLASSEAFQPRVLCMVQTNGVGVSLRIAVQAPKTVVETKKARRRKKPASVVNLDDYRRTKVAP